MKKKLICLLLAAMMVLALSVSAFASPQLYNVTDDAGLLTDDQCAVLEKMADQAASTYGVGIYIVTIDDYTEVTDDVYTTTYSIYHQYGMGEGTGRDGIMLLLSMKDRDYALFRYGDISERAFTKYGISELEEVFLDNFAEDDWYGGFEDYVRTCGQYLEEAANGHPVRRSLVVPMLFVIGLSVIIAAIVVGILWGRMKSVKTATTATVYVSGNLNLTDSSERFTHRTETRTKIESESSSGGSSRSGGGGSGSSGKF